MELNAIADTGATLKPARSLARWVSRDSGSDAHRANTTDGYRRGKWLLKVGLFGIAPVLLSIDLIVIAATSRGFAGDFRMELYPEAKLVVRGVNPFPPADASFAYHSLIWPVPAALAVSPLTLIPAGAAAAAFAFTMVAALLGSLWLLGVRDWRAYGFVGIWPATVSGFQAGNITPLLALLLALAWKYRHRTLVPGIAIGAAIALKIFLWPMIIWLVATRRWAAAGAAAGSTCLVFVSVLPFIGVREYVRLMAHLGEWFGPQGFGPIGFLSQTGAPLGLAQVLGYSVGLATLLVAWWRRSFQLTLAASLLISPIVWLHYFTLLLVPIALRSRSLGWLWAAPLTMWCCTQATHGSVAWRGEAGVARHRDGR